MYIAFRPLAPGTWKPNDWTGLLRTGAGGWLSTGFSEWGTGHRCFVSDAPRNGYVVQVAAVRDYQTFGEFQSAVRALPLKFSVEAGPEVTFTSLDGSVLRTRYGEVPSINGRSVDYAAWPLFESPFAVEKRESEKLDLSYRAERFQLDFKNNVRAEISGKTAK